MAAFILFILWCFHGAAVVSQETAARRSGASKLGNAVEKFILSLVLGIATGLICAALFAFSIRFAVRYMTRTPILRGPVVFSSKIAPHSLQAALSGENQVLRSSPGGDYYKAVLDNGLAVAVKRVEPFESATPEARSKSARRRLQRELETLAGLRHRNVISLRAFVWERGRVSLVYDFMPRGSLEDAMNGAREHRLQLGWAGRLRIAVGIVKGLEYLHFGCVPRVLHGDLQPANVMLDAELEPMLADTGMANFVRRPFAAASGYSAPECCLNRVWYTDKSDVYSFGAVLGVLLTGREPADPWFGEGGGLGRWLQQAQQGGEVWEALDGRMMAGEAAAEAEEMVMAARIAAVCLSSSPGDRPSSDELVSMLTQLHSF